MYPLTNDQRDTKEEMLSHIELNGFDGTMLIEHCKTMLMVFLLDKGNSWYDKNAARAILANISFPVIQY